MRWTFQYLCHNFHHHVTPIATNHTYQKRGEADENTFYPFECAYFYRNKACSTVRDSQEALGKSGNTVGGEVVDASGKLPFFFFFNLCPNILLCSSQEQEHKDLPAAKEAMSVFKALFKSEIRHEDHPFHKAWFLVMLTVLSRADFAQCKLWLHSFAWKNSTIFQSADQEEGYTNGKVYGELRTSLAK